jgi:hypothetical protein
VYVLQEMSDGVRLAPYLVDRAAPPLDLSHLLVSGRQGLVEAIDLGPVL